MLATTIIKIPSWGTITLIEVLWLAAGILAVTFPLTHMRSLWNDWLAARDTGRPVLTAAAGGYLRREIIRLLQGIAILIIGVYAAHEPNPLPGPAVVTPIGLVLTAVLLALGLLVSVQSWWDWHTRHQIQTMVRVGKNGDHEREDIP